MTSRAASPRRAGPPAPAPPARLGGRRGAHLAHLALLAGTAGLAAGCAEQPPEPTPYSVGAVPDAAAADDAAGAPEPEGAVPPDAAPVEPVDGTGGGAAAAGADAAPPPSAEEAWGALADAREAAPYEAFLRAFPDDPRAAEARRVLAPRPLADLVADGRVSARARGHSAAVADLELAAAGAGPLVVRVPPLLLVSAGDARDLVSLRATEVFLPAGGAPRRVAVDVASADLGAPAPDGADVLEPRFLDARGALGRLLAVLAERRPPRAVAQAAVWIVTDDARRADLAAAGGGAAPLSDLPAVDGDAGAAGPGAWPVVAEALALLREAAVPVEERRVWRDVEPLLAALTDPGVRGLRRAAARRRVAACGLEAELARLAAAGALVEPPPPPGVSLAREPGAPVAPLLPPTPPGPTDVPLGPRARVVAVPSEVAGTRVELLYAPLAARAIDDGDPTRLGTLAREPFPYRGAETGRLHVEATLEGAPVDPRFLALEPERFARPLERGAEWAALLAAHALDPDLRAADLERRYRDRRLALARELVTAAARAAGVPPDGAAGADAPAAEELTAATWRAFRDALAARLATGAAPALELAPGQARALAARAASAAQLELDLLGRVLAEPVELDPAAAELAATLRELRRLAVEPRKAIGDRIARDFPVEGTAVYPVLGALEGGDALTWVVRDLMGQWLLLTLRDGELAELPLQRLDVALAEAAEALFDAGARRHVLGPRRGVVAVVPSALLADEAALGLAEELLLDRVARRFGDGFAHCLHLPRLPPAELQSAEHFGPSLVKVVRSQMPGAREAWRARYRPRISDRSSARFPETVTEPGAYALFVPDPHAPEPGRGRPAGADAAARPVPLFALAPGVVESIDLLPDGWTLALRGAEGWRWRYRGLDALVVAPGDRVAATDALAAVTSDRAVELDVTED